MTPVFRSTCAAALACLGLAAPAFAQDTDLAKQLANPVADLVSVPFQFNWNQNIGPNDDGERMTLNVQPVIPFDLGNGWNLISRTIVPLVFNDLPGNDDTGLGDITQSFFFSPKNSTNGLTWGVGPAFLLPTGSDGFSADTFAAGLTGVVLRQSGPWTVGGLASHVWRVGDGPVDINQTFLQPFTSYAFDNGVSMTLNTETTYDWTNDQWTVPINAVVAKVFTMGNQPMSIGGGIGYIAEGPDSGAEGVTFRAVLTLIFPKS
ncbi:transporter [Pseudooceanicola nanhaiensis]|uniref:transporter n=1 Tax=Pseudooceanicola nanhaiensis TaxID=375761 RepID=UPI001CD2879D|nr:transporter [Pseudooceanicola nanhaiensis]MCA0920963.1 transporter [Pseudooceanicola nanhaiensis]